MEACEACQLHMRSQAWDPHRPALEYVSRSRSIRCDNNPPFFSREFKEFCDEYNPENVGAAERGVGLIKQIVKKTEEEGSVMEDA